MADRIRHGGRLDAAIARHGGRREDWLDLSTGINPVAWPVPPLPEHCWTRLPDEAAEAALEMAARAFHGVPKGFVIVAANGTQALIELLPRVLGAKHAAIVTPAYREHVHVWRKARVAVSECAADDVPADADILTIVNPNNPDASIAPIPLITRLEALMGQKGGTLVVDEAFCDPFPMESFVPHMGANTIVLRSFGKFFGLAGLRLGFAICAPEMVNGLRQHLGPWAVSGPALEIGRLALTDNAWAAATRERLFRDSAALASLLSRHGFEVAATNPLFVPAYHDKAGQIAAVLAEQHVLVRSFDEMESRLRFGLCANDGELQRLDAALADAMAAVGNKPGTAAHG